MLLFRNHRRLAMIVFPDRKRERFRQRVGAIGPGRVVAVAFGAVALALAGCSISMPMPSFIDGEPTGSIGPKAPTLSSLYDSRDWRVAEPVLAASLRAPGEGQPTLWSNSETGDHGEFLAVAGTFAREGRSCRAFIARLVDGQEAKTLQGVGCPGDSGEVAVYDVSPWTGL
jgi:surface antigen